MSKRTQDVTLIDTDGRKTVVPIPRRYARNMSVTELFDTASYVADFLEDAPINPRKAQEQDVESVLRWCL